MLERAASVASLVVRHLGAYGELVAQDLSVASAARRRRLWAGAVLAIAALLFAEIACFWLIATVWNTPQRDWVIGSMTALFLVVTCGAAFALRTLSRHSPGLLGLSAQEWEKDRRLLTELLEPRSAETL